LWQKDSVTKALQKFYKLWYYKPGMDSARLRVDRNSTGMAKGLTVSPDFFSNSAKMVKTLLRFDPGTQTKDTTLVDFETARLDIWHYNDDYYSSAIIQLPQTLAAVMAV